MVERQVVARGVSDPRVLAALRALPRERFAPERCRSLAYQDRPLPIGAGQTISQPYIVAVMTELLRPEPDDVVLEVGTGSGYQAALLARLVKQVYTIEILPELAQAARRALRLEGCANVEVIEGDGFQGLPEHAPFDGIVVTAAPERVPPPLLEQLAPGARLVIPVGGFEQRLEVYERTSEGVEQQALFEVRFVPMTGAASSAD